MENKNLESIKENMIDIISDFAEEYIDTLSDNHIINNMPVIKTVCSGVQAINSIRNTYNEKMLDQFIRTVNNGIITPGELNIHREWLQSNPKELIKEVSYILIKLNDISDLEKSIFFGNLYIAYLHKTTSIKKITWEKFTLYTEILIQISLYDINKLIEIFDETSDIENNNPDVGSMLRLQSLGLAIFHDGYVKAISKNPISGNVKKERWHITTEGKAFFCLIMNKNLL